MTPEQTKKRDQLGNRYRVLKAKLTFIGLPTTTTRLGLYTEKDEEIWGEAVKEFFGRFGEWMTDVEKFYKEVRKGEHD